MDAAAIAGRSGKAVWLTQLFRWTTSDFTLRLTTGGFVVWGGQTFLQRDPTWGRLAGLPTFEDGIDNQTTRANISVYPADHTALAAMSDRKHQGTLVEVYDASIDPDSGQLWGEPDLLFRGDFDFSSFVIGENEELILECGTEEARLNEPNEDRRLTDSHHREIWPGEKGLSYVHLLGRPNYWRQDQPGGSISGGGGYGTGGGGGVGGGGYAVAMPS